MAKRIDLNKLYENCQAIIVHRADSFAKSTGHEFDELRSEADQLFMKAISTWRPREGTFKTWLYRIVTTGLIDFINKQDPWRTESRDIEMDDPAGDYSFTGSTTKDQSYDCHNPARICGWRDALDNLTDEAQDVVALLLNGPVEALGIEGTEAPKMLRGAVVKHMRAQGIPETQCWKVLQEIKETVYAN